MKSAADAVRVAVVSDLHAFDRTLIEGDAPSFYDISTTTDDPLRSPTAGLLQLLIAKGTTADVLLIPGDISDKAHPTALQHAWAWINKCGELLGAKVVATPGNHDMDSRHVYNSHDPRGVLLGLAPLFPLPTEPESVNDRFWARNFVVLVGSFGRVIIVNSAAFHGGASDEIKHGRIADSTLRELTSALERDRQVAYPANILVCHHHPKQHREIGTWADYERMENGDGLLDLLGSGKYGEWILVHGHKHFPKFEYAGGGSASALILSAGSLSASLYPEIAGRARNQFYLMEIDRSVTSLRGRVLAWDWSLGQGWMRASGRGSGLPAVAGFGWRGSIPEMTERIASLVSEPFALWDSIRQAIPELDFTLPADLSAIAERLHDTHQMNVLFDDGGVPVQVGKGP